MEIKNNYLKQNIYKALSKDLAEEVTIDELKKIKCIILNNVNEKLERIHYNINDFECLKYIEKLIIKDLTLTDIIITKINEMKNLKTLVLEYCKFETENSIQNNINNLIVTYPKNFIYKKHINSNDIKYLQLIQIIDIDIKDLINYNIEELYIYNCNIINSELLLQLNSLKTLKLDGSNFNMEIFEELINKKITLQYNKKYYFN